MKLKGFLTAVMSLLSLLVFFLAGLQRNIFWLWVSFLCVLISGIFVQLWINRREQSEAAEDQAAESQTASRGEPPVIEKHS
jgi:energy-coupling factor transporter transmembrane protein EcfT